MQTCLLLLSLFIFAIFVAKRHAKKVFYFTKESFLFYERKKDNSQYLFIRSVAEPAFAQ